MIKCCVPYEFFSLRVVWEWDAQNQSKCCIPSSIYSWFLKPLTVLHSRFPTKKSWVVAHFWPPKKILPIFFHFFIFFIKQLFSADDTMWKKISKNFWPSKHEKTNPKSCILKQKFRRFRKFSFTAQQPKWKDSCFQMWPIEQLYIELGLYWKVNAPHGD